MEAGEERGRREQGPNSPASLGTHPNERLISLDEAPSAPISLYGRHMHWAVTAQNEQPWSKFIRRPPPPLIVGYRLPDLDARLFPLYRTRTSYLDGYQGSWTLVVGQQWKHHFGKAHVF